MHEGAYPENVKLEFARNPAPKPKAPKEEDIPKGKGKAGSRTVSHRVQKPLEARKRSLSNPSRRSDLAGAQSHNRSNSQRLRRSFGLGGVMPLDRGRDSEMSYLLGFGTDGVPTGMMAFP